MKGGRHTKAVPCSLHKNKWRLLGAAAAAAAQKNVGGKSAAQGNVSFGWLPMSEGGGRVSVQSCRLHDSTLLPIDHHL